MRFEWDAGKDLANQRKHGVSFDEARALFESGVEYLVIFDAAHSDREDRFVALGPIARGIAVVAWTERDEGVVRIISARLASPREAGMFAARMRGLQ